LKYSLILKDFKYIYFFYFRGAVDADGRIEPGDMILAVRFNTYIINFICGGTS